MKARAIHHCIHVLDLEKSLEFYEKALGLEVIRRVGPEDHSWELVFLGNETSGFQIELTWNDGWTEPYDNGNRDTHMAYVVEDMEAAMALHQEMGCVSFINERMGIYFIEDPDGCWIEILPEGHSRNDAQLGVDVLSAMSRRRSVRNYTDDPIDPAVMKQVLEAALRGAAGRGLRPWEFVVVEDRETLNKLAECREMGAGMLTGAAAAIVVVGDENVDTWIEDCSIAMANMHLTASALGLGSCWIQGRMRTAADGRSTQDYVAELLGLPEGMQLEAILSLGNIPEALPVRELDSQLWDKVHNGRW